MGVTRQRQILLVTGAIAVYALTFRACSEPKTCSDIVERQFRKIDRNLSYGDNLSDADITSGIDDPRVVVALRRTIQDVMPVYESGESYSNALEDAARKNCSRNGL